MSADDDEDWNTQLAQALGCRNLGVGDAFAKPFRFMGEGDAVHFVDQFAHRLIHLGRGPSRAIEPDLGLDLGHQVEVAGIEGFLCFGESGRSWCVQLEARRTGIYHDQCPHF